MYYFCTYFDHYYLTRGMALYHSLARRCPSFLLWVLCLDGECFKVLSRLRLPNVHLISLEEFEDSDEELRKTKEKRTRVEYYFTCTPSLPLFILRNYAEVDIITYLDSDLFFFDDPMSVYGEMADHEIGIIGHRFPPNLRDNEQYGIYNVGWVSFRRTDRAFACLRWWRERCLEWCYDRVEKGKFADQKYLDDWPVRFPGVIVLHHKGANLAPWNLGNYNIGAQGSRVWVDEQPLIFFHFHGFKQLRSWLYDPNLAVYKTKPSRVVLKSIYAPYISALRDMTLLVTPPVEKVSLRNGIRAKDTKSPGSPSDGLWDYRRKLLRWSSKVSRWIWHQSYILTLNGRVI